MCAENKSSLLHLHFNGKFYFIDCPVDGRSMLGKMFQISTFDIQTKYTVKQTL